MNYRELREAAGLSQADLARCVGVSQPAVAAYESGRRRPDGAVLDRYRVLAGAADGRTKSYGHFRGREVSLPDERWRSFVPHEGSWRLPVHLEWSTRRELAMADPSERRRVYEIVLAEGKPFDIRIWVDCAELIASRGSLLLPRHLDGPVREMVDRLARQKAGAA